jgi:radical SAM superfamily enzyme YgiQ (UPF0313 family)
MEVMGTRLRVLLVKPFQPVRNPLCQPPLGILYLCSALRKGFGSDIEVSYEDHRLFQEDPLSSAERIADQRYDLVGFSALNFEAETVHRMAKIIKLRSPHTLIALGGPYPHSSPERAQRYGGIDWIFDGEAELTLPQAVSAHFFGKGTLERIPGLIFRHKEGDPYISTGAPELPRDLDALPFPAWDLVPFDLYASRPNMNGWLKGKRYAPIFTSRGCPYRCNYCHDLFGKGFRWRSPENVLEEIELLHREYGVDEFHIIDDIYNLHKPRMRKIAQLIIERFGEGRLNFCFPNGVRADILDPEDLPLLKRMGVFQISVAVETVTPRLQTLIEKNLKIDRVERIINECHRLGILTKGFFMLGFPTETVEEIEATIRFAVRSRLTFAGFYLVIPQEGTPIYHLARKVSPLATRKVILKDFYNEQSWYQLAYGVDLRAIQRRAFRRFYLRPWRIFKLARVLSPGNLFLGFLAFLRIAITRDPVLGRGQKMMGRLLERYGDLLSLPERDEEPAISTQSAESVR